MNNEEINDTIFEALFRQAVIDDYVEEIDAIPSNSELAKNYSFSPVFEQRMKKLFANERKRDFLKTVGAFAKKAAAVFVIVTSIFFGVLCLSPDVRAVVGRVVVEWFEQFTSFTFNGEASQSDELILRPQYLPNGFYEDTAESFGSVTDVVFTNDLGDTIRFSYMSSDSATNFAVDNENRSIQQQSINGHNAFVLTALDDDFDNGVIFEYDGYKMEIWSMVSIDELIRTAESVSEVK